MTERVPNSVLRRVRDMLRRGDKHSEISSACRVGLTIIGQQSVLVRAVEGKRRLSRPTGIAHASHGEFDAYDVDLVDIFATPRTPRQIRRAMNGTGE